MKFLVGLFLTGCLFSSCSSVYHVPEPVIMPVHREKGDGTINASYQVTEWTEEFCLNGTVAAGKNLSLLGGLMTGKGGSGNGRSGNGNTVTLGAGYYLPFDEFSSFEVFSGFTHGNISNRSSHDYANLIYNKCFLQASVGTNKRRFSAALGFRYSIVDYISANSSNVFINETMSKTTYFLFEPAAHIGFGGKELKVLLFTTVNPKMLGKMMPNNETLAFGLSVRIRLWKNMIEEVE